MTTERIDLSKVIIKSPIDQFGNEINKTMNTPKHLKGLTYEPNKRRPRNRTKRRLVTIISLLLLPWMVALIYLLTGLTGFFDWVDRVFANPWVQLIFVLSLVTLSALLYFSRWVKNQTNR